MTDSKKDFATPKPGSPYIVPVDGSLGLLAVGYRGLIAWREAIRQHKLKEAQQGGQNEQTKG